MSDFDWKSIVKSVAPMIGTALGGPLGGIAGAALGKALGVDGGDQKALATAIQGATPDQLAAIQKQDQDFNLQMEALGFKNAADLEKIAADDRASARGREMAIRDKTPAVGFYLLSVGFFALLSALITIPIPDSNKAVVFTLVGTLGTAWIGAVQYYYGTTRSSGVKDQMLYNSTPLDGGQK
jgi:hypothetical protein